MGQQRIIEYGVRFNADQASLNNIRTQLNQLTAQLDIKALKLVDGSKEQVELNKIKQSINEVQQVFSQAFNSNLGTLNIQKLSQGLKRLNINQVAADFSELGAAGKNAFGDITAKILTTNTTLKKTNGFIANITKTLGDSLKWSLAYGAINAVGDAIRQSYDYIIDLDTSLNDIRIVTGKSADEMDRFAKQANKVAKELGVSTKAYTDASLIFYQQGLSDTESNERARITSMAANVTGQSASAVSEQLTAIWNGYKVDAAEAELYIDKVAKVAAQTGADLEELSTGMSKVASAANIMGVDIDELNAQLATVITVTRQAPESVGTAFKTIYARINAIESGSGDAETTLKNYTKTMLQYGVNVLDMNGKLRDTGDVIAEIGGKWRTMTKERQLGLAQAMAGQRQYNNLLSLFDNWGMYEQSLEISKNAAGTLAEQNAIYLESAEASLQRLSTSAERLYSSIFDVDSVKDIAGALSIVVDFMSNFMESIGGGSSALIALGAIAMKVFSNQIGSGLATMITNMELAKTQTAELTAQAQIASQFGVMDTNSQHYKDMAATISETYAITQNLTQEQRNFVNETVNGLNNAHKALNTYNEQIQQTENHLSKLGTSVGGVFSQSFSGGVDSIANDPQESLVALNRSSELTSDFSANIGQDEAYKKAMSLSTQMSQGEFGITGQQEVSEALTLLKDNIDSVTSAYEDNRGEIMLLEQDSQEYEQSQTELSNAYQELENAANEYREVLTKEGSASDKTKAAYEKMLSTQQKVGTLSKKVMSTLVSGMKNSNAATSQAAETLGNRLPAKAKNAEQAIKDLKSRFEGFKQSLNLEANLQKFTKGLSGIVSIASSFQTLSNLDDIWSDEDLSGGEKFLQIIQNIGFALPMLITGLSSLKGVGSAFSSLAAGAFQWANTTNLATMATKASTGALILSEAELTKENALRILSSFGIKAQTAEQLKKAAVDSGLLTMEELKNEETKEGVALKILEVIQTKIATAEGRKELAVKTAATIKEGLLNGVKSVGIGIQMAWNVVTAIGKALLGDYSGLALVAAGAVVALGVGIGVATSQQKKENAERQAAIENSKNLNEATNTLKESIQNTAETFNQYKTAVDTLSKCTKGTEEWDNALQNVESQMDALIKKFPELRDAYYWDEDANAWLIDEQAIKTAIEKEKAAIATYESAVTVADTQVEENKLADKKRSLQNKRGDFIDPNSIHATSSNSTTVNGQMVVQSAQVWEALDDFAKKNRGLSETEIRDQAIEFAKTNFGWSDDEINDNLSSMLDYVAQIYALEEEAKKLDVATAKEYSNQNMKAVQAALSQYTDENTSSVEEQFLIVQTSKQQVEEQQQLQKDLNRLFDKGADKETRQRLEEDYGFDVSVVLKGKNGLEQDDKTGGEAVDLLLEMTGNKFSEVTAAQWESLSADEKEKLGGNRENIVQGNDAERTFLLYEEATGKIANFSEDYVYSIAAAEMQLKRMGESAATASATLDSFQKAGVGAEALLELFNNGSLEGASVESIKAIQSAVGEDQSEAGYQQYAAKLDEAVWKQQGFDSAEAYGNFLFSKFSGVKEFSADKLQSPGAKKAFQEMYGEDGFSDSFDLGEQTQMGKAFQDIYTRLGTEGATALEPILKSEDALLALFNFDPNTQSYSDLEQALKDAGVELDGTMIPALETYYDRITAGAKTVLSAAEAEKQREEQLKVLKDLHYGDTITDEVFNTTFKGSPMEEFFTKTEDGMYMLNQDAVDWYNAIKEKSKEKFEEDQQGFEEDKAKLLSDETDFETKIAMLQNLGVIDEAFARSALEHYEKGDLGDRLIAAMNDLANTKGIDAINAKQQESVRQQMQMADTIEELMQISKKYRIQVKKDSEEYTQVLGKQLSTLGYTKTAFDLYVQSLIDSGEAAGLSAKEVDALALSNLQIQSGIETLSEKWEKWKETLSSEVKTPEYFTALAELSQLLSTTFGVDQELITPEFVAEKIELIGNAAEGDLPSVQKLRGELAKLKIDNLDIEGFEADVEVVNGLLDELVSQMDLEIGAEASISENFQTELMKMITMAGTAASEIEEIFSGLGFKIEYTYTQGAPKVFNDWNKAQQYVKDRPGGNYRTIDLGDGWYQVKEITGTKMISTGKGNPNFNLNTNKDDSKDKDTKDPREELDLEDELDLYHDINNELNKIATQRERLEKQSEHLIGQDLIDNLKKQNSLLEDENKWLDKKIERLRQESELLKENLLLKGVQFDPEGNILNYTELIREEVENINSLIRQLNAAEAAGQEAQAEALQKQLDEAEKQYEHLKETLQRYEEIIYDEIPSAYAEMEDNVDEMVGNNIKAFNAKIEVEIDLADFKKDWAEFQRSMEWDENNFQDIVDIADDKLKQLDQYYGAGGIIEKLTAHVQDLTTNGEGTYQTHTKEYLEDLKNYVSELMSNLEDAEALIDEIKEAFIELMDMAQEDFDAQISRYEALNGVLEHNINLLNLLDGEENNYAAKQAFYDKQTENYMAQLAFGKQQIAFWQEQLAFAEEGSEAAKAAEENLIAAIEANQSTLEEAIEAAQTAHINSIHAIFEELEDSITNSKGMNQLSKEWELIKENADYYLDDVNKAYELSKLESNYRKAIDESDSVYAQRQINDMMSSELAMLKEKDKLTQYDIDRANLKYQLTLKQIALEDAQKNKSTTRLKRDKNGNYSYQYVADSSATSQLEQEIADLNNQIHNLDKEALRNNLDEILSVWQDYKDALIEIEESGGTEEEKAEKRLAINALYKQKLQDLMTENQFMLTSIESATIATITGDWDNGVQRMIDAIQAEGGLEPIMTEVMDNITAKTKEYEQTMDDLAQAASKDLNEIYQGYDKNINILKPLIAENEDIISLYEVEMNSMRNLLALLDQMVAGYNAVRDAAMGALQSAVNQYEQISNNSLASNNTGNDNNPNTDWSREWAKEVVDGSSQYSLNDIISSRFKKLNGITSSEEDYAEDVNIGTYDNARIQHILDNIDIPAVKEWVTAVAEGKAYFTNEWRRHFLEGKVANWTSFNTGGYTGEWANGNRDGKLAFLHQKELVLKDTDTANILKAVDIVRALDINMMSRIAGMLDQIGLRSMGVYTPGSAPVEQNVHIDAHFPNVSSAQEIQEAFDQLADQLGQILYQNRK